MVHAAFDNYSALEETVQHGLNLKFSPLLHTPAPTDKSNEFDKIAAARPIEILVTKPHGTLVGMNTTRFLFQMDIA